MTDTNIEGRPAPESEEGKALAELEAEGEHIDAPKVGDEKKGDETVVETPEAKTAREETEKGDANEAAGLNRDGSPKDDKIQRTPTMVEAWKLHTAEGQKDAAIKQVAELQAKLDELSGQKGPVSKAQIEDIDNDIKAIAEESGYDETFLKKFANTILLKAKPSGDTEKQLKEIQDRLALDNELKLYSDEFEKDVVPLIKEKYPDLPTDTLSQLKSTLRDLAFSDTYAKVPLKEIFQIKESTLNIKAPKRSSENKGVRVRNDGIVDMDNLSETDFSNLSPEKVEEFLQRKGGDGGWKSPKK